MAEGAKNSKNPLGSSMIFKFIERSGSQVIALLINILLGRILAPDDYGLQAIIMVFAAFAEVLVETGFAESLVQRKDSDQADFSSLFWFCMGLCAVIYAIVFAIAPAVARFYDMPELKSTMRVFLLIVFPASMNSFQYAKMQKALNFKPYVLCGNISTIASGVAGVTVALLGGGVWALVAQQLTGKIVVGVMMWFMIGWRPTLEFSWTRLKGLVSYSWKLVTGSMLFTVINSAKSLVLGRYYPKDLLGFFSKGQYFPQLAVETVSVSVHPVLFSVLSGAQDDAAAFTASLRTTMRVTVFLVFPICAGLALVAEPAVELILGAKWLPCVPYLRIFCLYYAFYPIQSLNTAVINARGRTDVFLKVAAIVRIGGFLILMLVAELSTSITTIAVYLSVLAMISTACFMLPVHRRFGYTYAKQLADIWPSALLTAVMSALVWVTGLLPLHRYLVMLAQICAGAGSYFALAALLRLPAFSIIKTSLRSILGGLKKR